MELGVSTTELLPWCCTICMHSSSSQHLHTYIKKIRQKLFAILFTNKCENDREPALSTAAIDGGKKRAFVCTAVNAKMPPRICHACVWGGRRAGSDWICLVHAFRFRFFEIFAVRGVGPRGNFSEQPQQNEPVQNHETGMLRSMLSSVTRQEARVALQCVRRRRKKGMRERGRERERERSQARSRCSPRTAK